MPETLPHMSRSMQENSAIEVSFTFINKRLIGKDDGDDAQTPVGVGLKAVQRYLREELDNKLGPTLQERKPV